MKKIIIEKSPSADSRSAKCPVTVDTLKVSTKSHIKDVTKGLDFLAQEIKDRGSLHDHTKMEHMEDFCNALNSGKIKESKWYKKHITKERHHLKSNVPKDVNLIDVIEHVVDCTMAGLTRSGEVYDLDIDPNVLVLAVQNTSKLLKDNTKVVEPKKDILEESVED